MKKETFCIFLLAIFSTFPMMNADTAQNIVIESNDQMQFNIREFKVKAGQKIKLEFKHVGKLPKAAMGHNIVILKQGLQAVKVGPSFMQGGSPANNYVPDSQKNNVIAYTKLIGGGESVTIDFTVPIEKGVYEYLCTFPGHFGIMNGKMIVE